MYISKEFDEEIKNLKVTADIITTHCEELIDLCKHIDNERWLNKHGFDVEHKIHDIRELANNLAEQYIYICDNNDITVDMLNK